MKIYFYDMSKLSDSKIKLGYEMLDSNKKFKVDNCNNDERRRTIIASDLLTRTMLSQHLSISPYDITFAHSSHGKPILPNSVVQFNVSHSGNYWVGCVDSKACGIDIEVIREVDLNAAKRFATANEMEYINSHNDTNLALLEIWTRKEAYFKSIGCGIATVLSAVDVLREENLTTKINDDYIISVYSDHKDFEIINLEL